MKPIKQSVEVITNICTHCVFCILFIYLGSTTMEISPPHFYQDESTRRVGNQTINQSMSLRENALAEIERDVSMFMVNYSQQVNEKLSAFRTQAVMNRQSFPSSNMLMLSKQSQPTGTILDDILPPPPTSKKLRKNSDSSMMGSENNQMNPSHSEDEGSSNDMIDCSASGEIIKKRRSKLPLKAVLILRQWLSDHVQMPYPSDIEREQLAQSTGLTIKQVQNWFTNTRKRFWSPWVRKSFRSSHVTKRIKSSSHSCLFLVIVFRLNVNVR